MTTSEANQILRDAEKAGIDLNMLDLNLSLSVAERWHQHQQALEFAVKLSEAKLRRDAKLQPTPATNR